MHTRESQKLSKEKNDFASLGFLAPAAEGAALDGSFDTTCSPAERRLTRRETHFELRWLAYGKGLFDQQVNEVRNRYIIRR